MKKINLLLTLAVCAVSVQAAPTTVVVDDFSSLTLTPYTQTVVNQNGSSPGLVFSDSTGALTVSKSGGGVNIAVQTLFLRNDYTLGVGQTLRVGTTVTNSANYADFGIAIAANVSPLASPGTTDVRSNMIACYYKAQNAGGVGRAAVNSLGQNTGGSVASPGFANMVGLFIDHTGIGSYAVGYTTSSGDVTTFTYAGYDDSIGNAIGLYADVRSDFTYGFLDNLTITTIPEPSSIAMCGVGVLGLVFAVRRKK